MGLKIIEKRLLRILLFHLTNMTHLYYILRPLKKLVYEDIELKVDNLLSFIVLSLFE